MKSILEELFYGNVCSNTDCRNNDKETKELMGYIADHHETLLKELDDKQKATSLIESFIEKYSYLETSSHPTKMVDYLKMWKALQTKEVAETTYDGYHTCIDRHLIPYFENLNLNIQDIRAGHMLDYVNYLSRDGVRKDNKMGGQSATSIRKIISILRKVFDYAVLYGDIKINPAL